MHFIIHFMIFKHLNPLNSFLNLKVHHNLINLSFRFKKLFYISYFNYNFHLYLKEFQEKVSSNKIH